MKLLVLSITLAGAFATDVNPTCTGKELFGHVSVSSGALTEATITAANTPCIAETAATCFARTDGKQHFCDVTATCVADCSACTDKTIEGNKSATGGATSYTTATLSASNNTCIVATADLCFANSAAQHFCNATGKKGCLSACATCTDLTLEGNKSAASGATSYTTATLSQSNNTCQVATARLCFADSTAQNYCDVTGMKGCLSACATCTDKTIEGNKSASGGATSYTTATLSESNSTCIVATADLCFANSAGQHFCDVTTKKGCYSNCSTCTDKHTVGNMNDDGTTADATLSQSNNSCKLTTKEQCFNGKFGAGNKVFCDVAGSKACQANCDGAEPQVATSPAGTTAPGIFAALAAAVAFALRM